MRIEKVMFGYLFLLLLAVVSVMLSSGTVQASEATAAVQPTLQASLATIIQQVQSTVSDGVDFLKQEVPDVIKQLLVWKLASALVWALASSLLVLQLLPVVLFAKKYHKEHYDSYDFPAHIFLTSASLVVAAIASAAVMGNAMVALQIYIAPKVWLIEYAASLVK